MGNVRLWTEILRCFGSTDANIPLYHGIPAVALGTAVKGGAHTRGEWIDAESMADAAVLAVSLTDSLAVFTDKG